MSDGIWTDEGIALIDAAFGAAETVNLNEFIMSGSVLIGGLAAFNLDPLMTHATFPAEQYRAAVHNSFIDVDGYLVVECWIEGNIPDAFFSNGIGIVHDDGVGTKTLMAIAQVPVQERFLTVFQKFLVKLPVTGNIGVTIDVTFRAEDAVTHAELLAADVDRVDGIHASATPEANKLLALDGGAKIPTAAIPALAIGEIFPVNSEAEMLALTAQTGDVAKRMDLGRSFMLQVEPATVPGNWLVMTDDYTPASHLGDTGNPHGVTAAQAGAAPSSHVGSGDSAHALATETAHGFMDKADKKKCNSINKTYGSAFSLAAGDELGFSATYPHCFGTIMLSVQGSVNSNVSVCATYKDTFGRFWAMTQGRGTMPSWPPDPVANENIKVRVRNNHSSAQDVSYRAVSLSD
ncbi:MAG: phage tail protein [Deltaproteobacteria bacterium]|nr:phage tail protein [Deltaproteobacteria bacterium]